MLSRHRHANGVGSAHVRTPAGAPPERSLTDAARTYVRPAKVLSALKRRWFERRVRRVRMRHISGLIELGSAYGSWIMPGDVIEPSWTCYLVGAGGDVSVDLELVRRYGVTARSFDPVLDYVERARRDGRDEPRFSAHHAAIAARVAHVETTSVAVGAREDRTERRIADPTRERGESFSAARSATRA